jgi:FkbM family methyltransferase
MNTYSTDYGKITLYKNDHIIETTFKDGKYWSINLLQTVREYIPNRNILEIGGHCGTSSIVYSSFLSGTKKVYVYEPQKYLYTLLLKNIEQNNLQSKIIPHNYGVFCYDGSGVMNGIDLDGCGVVARRYNQENNLGCNFGGIGLGYGGETVKLTTLDTMNIEDIGFIHCHAQGSENFIFSKGLETITRTRPVILFEDSQNHFKYHYHNVCSSYPKYKEESVFDVKKYCMETLKYSKCINNFHGNNILLIP